MKINKDRPNLILLLVFIPVLVAFSFTSKLFISGIIPLIAILFSYFNNFYFERNSIKTTIYTLMVLGLSILFHNLIIPDLPAGNGPHIMSISILYLVSCLWYYKANIFVETLIVGVTLISLLFSGNNLQQADGVSLYYYLVYGSMPFLTLYLFFREGKKLSKEIVISILMASIFIPLLIMFFNKSLFFADEKINEVLVDLINKDNFKSNSSYTGLSSDFEIQSHVNLKQSNDPILLVKYDRKIDYLKAQVFSSYENKKWDNKLRKEIHPYELSNNKQEYLSFDYLYSKNMEITPLSEGKIEFIEKNDKFIPLPYYAKVFKKSNTKTRFINHYTLENEENISEFYFYGSDSYFSKYNKNTIKEGLSINYIMRDELREKALEITKGSKSNIDKAKKIAEFFHKNFKYSLNVSFDPKVEPILDFVFKKKKGFCSHFSSAMALMLRSIDVPCNVIGGYFTEEYDNYLKSYVVRKKDAHAWVEVYDEKNNLWIPFDPTPVNQMLEETKSNFALFDDIELYFKSYKNRLSKVFTLDFIIKGIFVIVGILIFIIIILFIIQKLKTTKKTELNYEVSKEISELSKKITTLIEKNELPIAPSNTYKEIMVIVEKSTLDKILKEYLLEIITKFQSIRYKKEVEKEEILLIKKLLKNEPIQK